MSALRMVRDERPPAYDSSPANVVPLRAENAIQARGYMRLHREVLEQCGLYAATVYGYLEDLVQLGNRTGEGCFPSHQSIAEATYISVSSVRRALEDLRKKGFVQWSTRGDRTSNSYTLPHYPKPQMEAQENAKSVPTERTVRSDRADLTPEVRSHRAEGSLSQNDYLEQTNNQDIPNGILQPYAAFEILCAEADMDLRGFSRGDVNRNLAVAKRLINDGGVPLTESDLRRFARWLRAQSWWHGGITMFDVEKRIGEWRADGRPGVANKRALKPGTPEWAAATGKAVL